MSDFKWVDTEGEDDDSVVFPSVDAVAVYPNTKNCIVIRQRDSMGGEDAVVIIPKMYVEQFILAVKQAAED